MATARNRIRSIAALWIGALALAVLAAGCGASGEGSGSAESASPPTQNAPSFSGRRIRDFSMLQAAPGAIHQVPDPLGSGQPVFQLTVDDEDVYPITPTENPRAQLVSPPNIEPGDELWWASKFLLPESFPDSVPGWLVVLEGPYGPPYEETPPWHIEVFEDQIRWSRNGTYGFDVPWQMPLVKGRWITVAVHERFAEDGWVEMWIDGKQVTFFPGDTTNPNGEPPTKRLQMETMDRTNDAEPNSLYLLNYRKAGMFDTVTTYSGPLEIGRTRTAVERAVEGGTD